MSQNTAMKTYPYGRQSISQADVAAVAKALSSDYLTQGPLVVQFERKLCEYTGAKHAVAVANGTVALHLAALALEIGPGDEAITSPNTFLASANCVAYCGGDPTSRPISTRKKSKRKSRRKRRRSFPCISRASPATCRRSEKLQNCTKT